MMIIKCKMCGGNIELSADKTFGTCDSCGSTMTLPKIDDEHRAAAFNRGNHFRRIGEFDMALKVYEKIVEESPSDAEAHWCCALCRFGIEYVEDPTTYEWVPTCHRASFDNFLEDVDYIAAIDNSDGITRREYQKHASRIAQIQHDILATGNKEEPYDIFICYKESDSQGNRTIDSTIAQDIYYQLTEKGYRVFFARITLEDKGGTEYEPYIFAALNSAKVMIVLGTSADNFNAVWVKNEWSRYLNLIKKDRSRLILPCYRDMDPYDLPEQLSVLQSYDMGKIGFIQDLIHGISKVMDSERSKTETSEPVVKKVTAFDANADALIKRGFMALDDRNWSEAEDFFNRALDMDAECGKAYLGRALAHFEAADLNALKNAFIHRADNAAVCKHSIYTKEFDNRRIALVKEAIVPKYSDEDILKSYVPFDFDYDSITESLKDIKSGVEKELGDRNLARAAEYGDAETKNQIASVKGEIIKSFDDKIALSQNNDKKKAEEKLARFEEMLTEAKDKLQGNKKMQVERREKDYIEAVELFEKAEYVSAMKLFSDEKLFNYKESKDYIDKCRKGEKEAFKEKNKKLFIALIFALVSVVTLITLPIIIDNIEQGKLYKDAQQHQEDGEAYLAAVTFYELEDYKDARKRSFEIWGNITQRDTISGGYGHIVAIQNDGTVVAAGDNDYGQCNVDDWTDIAAASAVDNYTVGLKTDGTVIAVGAKAYGQLFVENWTDIVAISSGTHHTVGLKADGTVVATGNNDSGQCDIDDWTDITAISACGYYTVGLKSDGTVVATGENAAELNVSDWKGIVAISAGLYHTIGLKSDGTVVATGSNRYNQCDVAAWTDIAAISAGEFYTVGLKSDGTVVAVGENKYFRCSVDDWTDIVAISAGEYHTIGLKSDGKLIVRGYNGDGKFEISNWADIKLPKK